MVTVVPLHQGRTTLPSSWTYQRSVVSEEHFWLLILFPVLFPPLAGRPFKNQPTLLCCTAAPPTVKVRNSPHSLYVRDCALSPPFLSLPPLLWLPQCLPQCILISALPLFPTSGLKELGLGSGMASESSSRRRW